MKRSTGSHNHNEDDFYFDISGDFSNLKNTFLTKMQIPSNKRDKKYLQQNSITSKNHRYNSINSSSSTETNSGDEQKIKNVHKSVKKNKNIYIKYKYHDNCDTNSTFNNKLNGADKDMLILRQKAKSSIQTGK